MKTNLLKLTIFTFLITGKIFAQTGTAHIPTNYDWAPASNYPDGWYNYGLTSYTTGNIAPNAGKFDTQFDSLVIKYDTVASNLSYYLKEYSVKTPYQFDVSESADGKNYSILISHTDSVNSITGSYQLFKVHPSSVSRFIKFIYTVRTGGNIAIDDVSLDNNITIDTAKIIKAHIPTSYNWDASIDYPDGWYNYGLTFYTTGNTAPNSGKFDTQSDSLVIKYDTVAGNLSYYLKENSLSTPYQFDVDESEDGTNYLKLISHTDTANSLTGSYQHFNVYPSSASRFIKFVYSLRTAGNIAIDDVVLENNITSVNNQDIEELQIR